jgi:hypothetical protein
MSSGYLKHLIIGKAIIVISILLIVAVRTKDPVMIRYGEVISWIQSDHPDLLSEKQVLEIYPELKEVKLKVDQLITLKNRIYSTGRYPENCSARVLENRIREDRKRIIKLQEEIALKMDSFNKRHHLVIKSRKNSIKHESMKYGHRN